MIFEKPPSPLKIRPPYGLNLILGFIVVLFFVTTTHATDSSIQWTQTILQVLNAQPDLTVAPIIQTDIQIKGTVGKVMINKVAKYSFYIQLSNDSLGNQVAYLIPMSTSRFTPGNYSTEEWWEANKSALAEAKRTGTFGPRQDPTEVLAWLRKMRLSTNPFVYKITASGVVNKIRLQNYLFQMLSDQSTSSDYISFYRGAEKTNESSVWASGNRPKGARYWTPSALYGWRYARKSPSYTADLITGTGGILAFKLHKSILEQRTLSNRATMYLGTELPKSAHERFNSSGSFEDIHVDLPFYLGQGNIGVEIELRSSTSALPVMVQSYSHFLSALEMYFEFSTVFKRSLERLVESDASNAEKLKQWIIETEEIMQAEVRLIMAYQKKIDVSFIQKDFEFLKKKRRLMLTSSLSGALSSDNFLSVYNNLQNEMKERKKIRESKKIWQSINDSFNSNAPICSDAFQTAKET